MSHFEKKRLTRNAALTPFSKSLTVRAQDKSGSAEIVSSQASASRLPPSISSECTQAIDAVADATDENGLCVRLVARARGAPRNRDVNTPQSFSAYRRVTGDTINDPIHLLNALKSALGEITRALKGENDQVDECIIALKGKNGTIILLQVHEKAYVRQSYYTYQN